MKRFIEIDILKGIAVLCMIIFHFFYFPNQYGFKEIEYNTRTLKIIAKIAQVIFITCVGINLVLSFNNSKDKNEYQKKQIKRIIIFAFYALLMTIFTYMIFNDKFVKFGILHFIALSSLLLFMFVDNLLLIGIIMIIVVILYIMNIFSPESFYILPEKLAFISGFYNFKYTAIDHFSIIPWILLICIGILIGHYIIKKDDYKSPEFLIQNQLSQYLKKIGKYSLEIYAIHWVVLYFVFCIIYSKYFRQQFISS